MSSGYSKVSVWGGAELGRERVDGELIECEMVNVAILDNKEGSAYDVRALISSLCTFEAISESRVIRRKQRNGSIFFKLFRFTQPQPTSPIALKTTLSGFERCSIDAPTPPTIPHLSLTKFPSNLYLDSYSTS